MLFAIVIWRSSNTLYDNYAGCLFLVTHTEILDGFSIRFFLCIQNFRQQMKKIEAKVEIFGVEISQPWTTHMFCSFCNFPISRFSGAILHPYHVVHIIHIVLLCRQMSQYLSYLALTESSLESRICFCGTRQTPPTVKFGGTYVLVHILVTQVSMTTVFIGP